MSFASRFLAGEKAATAFLDDGFRRPDARARAVELAAARPVQPALVAALTRQAAAMDARSEQRAAILALGRPGTVAVVTGQQVGLHLGPLYTIHKAAAAIVTARALAEETGRAVVPVFWLQTEDHDLEEIREVAVPAPDGPLRLALPDDGRDRVSVWHRALGPEVARVQGELREALAPWPRADEVCAFFERHYAFGRRWHEAFAGALSELFGEHGLVLLDPRDPEIARLAAPVLRRSITEASAIAAELSTRAAALSDAGFEAQVHVREGSPLAFLHPDGPEGPRFRLDPTGDGYTLVGDGHSIGRAEVLAALTQDPRTLSTSALLRPIVQDTLLPTAMVLGGPGEIAYFAQLAPLYARFGLPMPLVGPRASLRIIDSKARSLCDALGIAPADAGLPRDALLARLLTKGRDGLPPPEALWAELLSGADGLLRTVQERTRPLERALEAPLDKTRRSLARSLEKLAHHYERTLATHDAVAAGRVDRLAALLHPGGPQERVYGVAAWAARFGLRELTSAVLGACEPYDGRTKDIEP